MKISAVCGKCKMVFFSEIQPLLTGDIFSVLGSARFLTVRAGGCDCPNCKTDEHVILGTNQFTNLEVK